MAPRPYDLTTHDGKRVDYLTHLALLEVEARLGYSLTVTQGSYNAGGVKASAGTHDGGGVVDLAPYDAAEKVLQLRKLGFAAWYRAELPGVWGPHIHAVLIGNRRLSAGARHQVDEYLAGRNGLANRMPDNGPRGYTDHRFTWRMGIRRVSRARALIREARAVLASGIRGYPGIRAARAALGRADDLLPKAP